MKRNRNPNECNDEIENTVSRKKLKHFTCPQLRNYLESKGISTKGRKDILIDKVNEHLDKKRKERQIKQKIQEVAKLSTNDHCSKIRSPITAQQLHDVIHQFSKKDPHKYTVKQLQKVIEIIGPASYIDMKDVSPEALETFESFYQPWASFVLEFPELKQILDPHFIIFDFGPLNAKPNGPPGWAAALLNVANTGLAGLPITPLAPPPVLGVQNECVYQIGGENEQLTARHFGGFMQGAIPHLRFWDFSLPAPPPYW